MVIDIHVGRAVPRVKGTEPSRRRSAQSTAMSTRSASGAVSGRGFERLAAGQETEERRQPSEFTSHILAQAAQRQASASVEP